MKQMRGNMKQNVFGVLILTIVLAMGLLSGCKDSPSAVESNAHNLTIEQATKINTVENLLESYKTATVVQLDHIGGKTSRMIFSADDFRLLSMEFSLIRPDSTELKIASAIVLYDLEISYTDEVQGYLDSEKVAVTVQMEDGSIQTAEIPKGETFTWYCDDGYAFYLDEEGKSPLPEEPEPVNSNMTLYCLPNK